jgi:hypothetical protein
MLGVRLLYWGRAVVADMSERSDPVVALRVGSSRGRALTGAWASGSNSGGPRIASFSVYRARLASRGKVVSIAISRPIIEPCVIATGPGSGMFWLETAMVGYGGGAVKSLRKL